MTIIIEETPEAIRLEFQELNAGWHSLGECEATTSVGPRGFGALSVTGATASPAVRMALELYGETPLAWRWTRVEDGARFEGKMQGAGIAFDSSAAPNSTVAVAVNLDLIALETVKRVDQPEPTEAELAANMEERATPLDAKDPEPAELDETPEKLAALEALAGLANGQVAAAVRRIIQSHDPEALTLAEAISAAVAGAQDAIVRVMASAIDDSDLTFENLEAGFGALFAEIAPVIIAERLLAGQPEGLDNAG